MKARVKIKDKNRLPQAISSAKDFDGRKVKVGYFGSGHAQMLAAVHEFGVDIQVTEKMRKFFIAKFGIGIKQTTTHIKIPERSFIRAGWDEHGPEIIKKYKKLIGEAIVNGVPAEALLYALALEAKGKLQDFARDLKNPANEALTVQEKGSSNPLVDSGNMIASMDHKIE
jgi:hypothetical protein